MPEADKYFDPLRRKWVAATPEERVRQWFIGILAEKAGVPVHMMMSEVPMNYGLKKWRADIVVWSPGGNALGIVECKRPDIPIDASVAAQALRYHAVGKAGFIFLTNGTDTHVFKRDGEGFKTLNRLPTYTEMKEQCRQ
jgi:type I site-specific restriction endonuclease